MGSAIGLRQQKKIIMKPREKTFINKMKLSERKKSVGIKKEKKGIRLLLQIPQKREKANTVLTLINIDF